MLKSSPRPLFRDRLEKIVHGLRIRMSLGNEKLAAELDLLQQATHEAARLHQNAIEELVVEQQQQFDASTTEWDEAFNKRWDTIEQATYRAIADYTHREEALRTKSRQRLEKLTAEAKTRAESIERRFVKAKDVPVKRLNQFRHRNQLFLDELRQVESSLEESLAQRSLRVPLGDLPPEQWQRPANSTKALEELHLVVSQARTRGERLRNHPLARFFDSVAWWTICCLLFVLVSAGLAFSGALSPLFALLTGAIVTTVMLLLGFLGVRPWLRQVVAAEYPKLHAQFNHGRWLHDLGNQLAVEENDAELKRLAEKRDLKLHKNSESLEREIYSLKERLKQDLAQCRAEIADQKRSASEQLSLSLDQTNRIFSQRIDSERAQAAANKTQLTASWEQQSREKLMRLEELRRSGASRMEGAVAKALQVVSRSKQWCDEHFPSWPHLAKHVEQWPEEPEVLCLPVADLSIDGLFPNKTVSLANNASLQSPIFFSPLRDGYLVVTGDPSDPAIVSTLRSIVVRALTSLPAGKAQVCIIDPPGMGRDFGWLLHLADVDPQLVTHRVWTQTTHIGNQLSTLALAAEDFIQQSLRNQYADIASYNREAGALAEPYRVLVWSSLPAGLDDHGWRSLRSLLESGARCGIFPILVVDPNLTWPSDEARTFVYRRGMHLTFDSQSREFILDSQAIQGLRIVPTVPPDHVETQHIIQEIGRRAVRASRVEVPLDSIVASGEQLWQGDSSHGLDIPIGQSGVGRSHSLRLGVGTAQHAIIAGKTGSGKSSLLHALITSAALKYSPESLRMVLLDFKKGVEFQLYADTELPHTDIIGIESHREFGLSALESIDSWMQRRGEAFRQAGVQNVASWNALHPEIPMPRVLLVIDEFQELFVEDDRLSSQASLILDRIVRQGRSFGVHAVLSSQTLAGSYSLPRTTLGQMSVRIALQCDASDAQIIFSEDNPAASRLKFPGQAVYNDAGGRIEGNQPMQIGWLSQTEQKQWFSKLELGYRNSDSTTNRLGRCVVYDGNRAAAWDNANADLALMNARKESNPDAMWCVVGESVAISPAVVFPLTRQAGRNALVVGGDDARAAATLNAITASFVKAWYSKVGPATSLPARLERVRPEVFVFQGAKPTDTHTLRLPEIWQQFDCNLHVSDTRECDVALARVYELLQKRLEDKEDEKASAPVLVHFLQIGRLRSLRRDDEYGLGSFGEANISPDKQLEEILRDGPSHGIHVMIWADSYSTVNRWLSRSALREMDLRILMQMSSSDSTNLIESIAASRLGDHVMLLFDEAIGQEQRFRPFDVASLGDLSPWAATP